jgi:hypothetical protein
MSTIKTYASKVLISKELIIPEKYVGEFIVEFGKKFAVRDETLGMVTKKVDDYYEHPNGWHVTVSLQKEHEPNFTVFMHDFCKNKDFAS